MGTRPCQRRRQLAQQAKKHRSAHCWELAHDIGVGGRVAGGIHISRSQMVADISGVGRAQKAPPGSQLVLLKQSARVGSRGLVAPSKTAVSERSGALRLSAWHHQPSLPASCAQGVRARASHPIPLSPAPNFSTFPVHILLLHPFTFSLTFPHSSQAKDAPFCLGPAPNRQLPPEMSSPPATVAGIPAPPEKLQKKPVKFSNLLRK